MASLLWKRLDGCFLIGKVLDGPDWIMDQEDFNIELIHRPGSK